jgi:glycosyltransferase involved in cell wall biosynthesis
VSVASLEVLLWFWGRRGGGAQYTCALAEGFAAHSEVHVSGSVSNRLESLARFRQSVTDAQIVSLDRSARSLPLLLPGPTSFGATVKRTGAEVVLHTMVNPLTPIAWPRGSSLPVATVIHDADPHPGDTVGLFERANRFAQTHSNLLIAPSESVGEILRARYPRASIETIALPPLLALPDLWDPKGDVLFLGRIARYKGLDLLADTWSEMGDLDVPLRVLGQPVADEPSLDRLRGLGAIVETRWVPDEQLPDVMRGVRLIVLPYVEASQSGVVTLAHAAGIPLLVTDVGGLRAQAGASALITLPTVSSLGAGLRLLLSDPLELMRLRVQALAIREQSERMKSAVTEQFVEALHRLLGRSG